MRSDSFCTEQQLHRAVSSGLELRSSDGAVVGVDVSPPSSEPCGQLKFAPMFRRLVSQDVDGAVSGYDKAHELFEIFDVEERQRLNSWLSERVLNDGPDVAP